MKKTFALLLLLILGSITGGSEAMGQTHQKDIISFCDANMGKKIGKGLCYELVQGAFRQYIPSYDMGAIKKNTDRYGKRVKEAQVQVGDIVLLDGANIEHVGIVYKIVDGKIYVAEQNTKGNLKKSVLEVNVLDQEALKKDYGKVSVSFFRPE